MRTVVVTVACANYLAPARALAASAKEHLRDHLFILCLVEREVERFSRFTSEFDRIVSPANLGVDDLSRLLFGLDVIEASTAIKPALLRHAFETIPDAQEVIFLDPDMLVFRDFEEVWHGLVEKPVLLTPHVVDNEPTYQGTRDNLLRALKYGIFNLGFLAMRRNQATHDLLAWWTEKLNWFCFREPQSGVFVDQLWMNLAPCLFDVGILKSRAFNVANWNVEGRQLHRSADGSYQVGHEALALYHFSGIFENKDLRFLKPVLRSGHPYYDLRAEYLALIDDYDHRELKEHPWSYSTFHSGEVIEHRSRLAYRRMPHGFRRHDVDPYSLDNAFFDAGHEDSL